MAEIRKGMSWTSLTALIIGVGLIVFLAWSAVNKKQEVDNYAKGSYHNETTLAPVQHAYPMCCARFIMEATPDGVRAVDLDRKKRSK